MATDGNAVVGVCGLDVTDSAQVDDLFDSIAKERGAIDILVNSAGLGQDVCHTVELSNDNALNSQVDQKVGMRIMPPKL